MELIVETHGVLVSKHQGRLRVMREKEKLQEVPLVMLEQVLITSSGVAVTSDVVRACSENGIPIHFVSGDGRSYGTLYSSGLTGTIQTRRAQLEAYADERGATLAHAFVRGKLENQINLLRAMAKNRRENDLDCFEEIQHSAFWGDLPRTLQEELLLKIRRVLQGKAADVRLIPLCERDLARSKQLIFSEKGAARAS